MPWELQTALLAVQQCQAQHRYQVGDSMGQARGQGEKQALVEHWK